jgi:hypothetical protein
MFHGEWHLFGDVEIYCLPGRLQCAGGTPVGISEIDRDGDLHVPGSYNIVLLDIVNSATLQ